MHTYIHAEFLKATPEFQERYLECVIERIYYANSYSETDKMSVKELKKSNLVRVACVCMLCMYICMYVYTPKRH